MGKLKKILIMAGGTGGHVFPGLTVAKTFYDNGIAVEWLGTEKGLEAKLVPAANIPIHFISIAGVRGKGFKTLLAAPFKLLSAVNQAKKIIKKVNPDIVIGMGGFASGPGGIAAWRLGIPLVIHEQNAKPGMTNKWLSKVAKKVLQAFPNTFLKGITIGNPVRPEIAYMHHPEDRFNIRKNPLRLLVLGGSLGATALNEIVPQALSEIPREIRPKVTHQTGEKHLELAKKNYEKVDVEADIVPFIQDMGKAYESSDLVLCRSGALTVSELCAAGLGAILVPFPFAVDDHQTLNAQFMAKKNAAVLIQQKDLTPEKLATILQGFCHHPEKCLEMAKAAYQLRIPDAATKVLMICEEVL